jgi:putative transposase
MPHPEKAFLPYNFVEALFKVMKQTDYISMPSQSNQQTMKKVYDDWKSFFEASKKYRSQPTSFSGKPKIPKYKPKNGPKTVYLTNQSPQEPSPWPFVILLLHSKHLIFFY